MKHLVRTSALVCSIWIATQLVPGSAGATEFTLPPESVALKPSSSPGFQIAQQKCGICHSADYIALQPPAMTLSQWTAELQKMQHAYGAPIDDADIRELAIYLATEYGDAKTASEASQR